MPERLHKVMAAAGVASRRKCEEIIRAGRVTVNGRRVTEMGLKVDLESDHIEVDGRRLRPQRIVVLAMNKPKGVVTTLRDPGRRRTVADLLPDLGVALRPVGRLDFDTEGLLLFTNDGELAARLTHPRYAVWKTYHAEVRGRISDAQLERLRKGVALPPAKARAQTAEGGRSPLRPSPPRKAAERRDERSGPAEARLLGYDTRKARSVVEVSIHEGRYRQVRRMFEAVGAAVTALKRVRIGPLELGRLRPGECRVLSKPQIARLRKAAGFSS